MGKIKMAIRYQCSNKECGWKDEPCQFLDMDDRNCRLFRCAVSRADEYWPVRLQCCLDAVEGTLPKDKARVLRVVGDGATDSYVRKKTYTMGTARRQAAVKALTGEGKLEARVDDVGGVMKVVLHPLPGDGE